MVRRGARSATPSAVYYRLEREPAAPLRFGFIVSKEVGKAVDRNLVKRRLRALGRRVVETGVAGADVVVRVLPGSAQQDWVSLTADMSRALRIPLDAPTGRQS